MSAQLSDYDYPLPRGLVASRPLPQRDESRMMVLRRDTQTIEHRQFRELKSFLYPGDLLVLNDTRVLAARKFSDDGAVEFLVLERLGPKRWKSLVKPGRKMRIGASAEIDNVTVTVEEILPDGERIIVLSEDVDLYAGGSMPLPPYIERPSDADDSVRYQTVFASRPGAVAAPTAGLHFTPEMLSAIRARGVEICELTLDVGLGTFQPIHSETLEGHVMHAESYEISEQAAQQIQAA